MDTVARTVEGVQDFFADIWDDIKASRAFRAAAAHPKKTFLVVAGMLVLGYVALAPLGEACRIDDDPYEYICSKKDAQGDSRLWLKRMDPASGNKVKLEDGAICVNTVWWMERPYTAPAKKTVQEVQQPQYINVNINASASSHLSTASSRDAAQEYAVAYGHSGKTERFMLRMMMG